MATAINT